MENTVLTDNKALCDLTGVTVISGSDGLTGVTVTSGSDGLTGVTVTPSTLSVLGTECSKAKAIL